MKMWFIERPWADVVLTVIFVALLIAVGKLADIGVATSTRTSLAGAVTAFAGIAAAADIFVCSYLYSSTNERLVRILNSENNPTIMARNWISVLLGTLGSAVAAILALALNDIIPTVSLAVMLGATLLTACGLLRAIYWLDYAFLQERLSKKLATIPTPEGIPTKPVRRPKPTHATKNRP